MPTEKAVKSINVSNELFGRIAQVYNAFCAVVDTGSVDKIDSEDVETKVANLLGDHGFLVNPNKPATTQLKSGTKTVQSKITAMVEKYEKSCVKLVTNRVVNKLNSSVNEITNTNLFEIKKAVQAVNDRYQELFVSLGLELEELPAPMSKEQWDSMTDKARSAAEKAFNDIGLNGASKAKKLFAALKLLAIKDEDFLNEWNHRKLKAKLDDTEFKPSYTGYDTMKKMGYARRNAAMAKQVQEVTKRIEQLQSSGKPDTAVAKELTKQLNEADRMLHDAPKGAKMTLKPAEVEKVREQLRGAVKPKQSSSIEPGEIAKGNTPEQAKPVDKQPAKPQQPVDKQLTNEQKQLVVDIRTHILAAVSKTDELLKVSKDISPDKRDACSKSVRNLTQEIFNVLQATLEVK